MLRMVHVFVTGVHIATLILVISSLICNIHLRKDIPVCDARILNVGVYVVI
jgi:hypothetical protein